MKEEEEVSVSPQSSSYLDDEVPNGNTELASKKYTVKYKRPRTSRACVTCHDRKVRCDSQFKMPCSNCVSFHCECILPSTKRVRRTKREIMEERLKASQPDKTESLQKTMSLVDLKKSSKDYKKLIQSSENELLFLGSSLVMSSSARHYKRIKSNDKVPTISDVDMKIIELKGCLFLPSEDICHELIDLYFLHLHPFMPVLNRAKFLKSYYNKLDDPPSLILLHCVLLCGSRFSSNPLLLDEKGSVDKISQILYDRAKTLYDMRVSFSPIDLIQSILILCWYWEGPDDVTQNIFYWTRILITLAQGYGFNKTNNYWMEQDAKIWKRCWWMIFCRDRVVALSFGRSIVIDLEDCDVPMMTPDDFIEDWDGEGENPYNLTLTQLYYFINYVKICEIIGVVLKQKYTVQLEKTRDPNNLLFIKKCDLMMVNWLNNLPVELQYSVTNPEKHNLYGAMIMCHYYLTLSLIHRTNILQRQSTSSLESYYPSWGITFQSSHMITIICKNIMDKGELKFCPTIMVPLLFSALIMLIYHVDNKNPKICATLKKLVEICSKLLLVVSKSHSVGYICLQMAETLKKNKAKRNVIFQNNLSMNKMNVENDISETEAQLTRQKIPLDFEPAQLFPAQKRSPDEHQTYLQQQLHEPQLKQESPVQPPVVHLPENMISIQQQHSPLSNLRSSPNLNNQYSEQEPPVNAALMGNNFNAFDLPDYNFELFDKNLNLDMHVNQPGPTSDSCASSVGGGHNNINMILASDNDSNYTKESSGVSNDDSKIINYEGNNEVFMGDILDDMAQLVIPPTTLNLNEWFNFLHY